MYTFYLDEAGHVNRQLNKITQKSRNGETLWKYANNTSLYTLTFVLGIFTTEMIHSQQT